MSMSARHYLAVSALDSQETDVDKIVSFLQIASKDCEIHNKKPHKDPAFILLASQLAFLTNTDTYNSTTYQRYYKICKQEVFNDVAAVQSPEALN
jgi:hypothetical protein